MSIRAMMIQAAKEATGNTSKMIFESIKKHKGGDKTEDQIFKQPIDTSVLLTAKL